MTDEQTLRDAVREANLTRDNAEIARGVRLSGSADEAEAFAYLAGKCAEYGLTTTLHTPTAYVSLPRAASLAVTVPEAREVACITHSFSRATPPHGLAGEVVDAGDGTDADYARVDARGKIALVVGLAMPAKAFAADRAGAVGLICANPEGLHEMIISPVWGTPTPETAAVLPHLVAVSVRREDGDALRTMCASGEVTVRVHAAVTTEWTPIPVLIADVPGTQEDRYVLLSGHVDSWHYGAMDNASANATMLEIARIFGEHRGELRRGLRLAFWSGHSHARYGGSAWYADTAFGDLYDRCVCHVNAESTGGMGADDLTGMGNMAETWRFAADAVRNVTGQTVRYRRMARNSDQSFTGVGVASAFSGLSAQPTGGLGWWWHTPDDTLDKVDAARLVRDTQVYLLACWRLCTAALLPFDYAEAAREVRERLDALHALAGGRFDLAPLVEATSRLHAAALRVNAETAGGDRATGDAAERINAALLAAGRALIPATYTAAGPFAVDLALDAPVLPGLADLAALAALDPVSDAARFLATRLVRERNRVWHALTTAAAALEQC